MDSAGDISRTIQKGECFILGGNISLSVLFLCCVIMRWCAEIISVLVCLGLSVGHIPLRFNTHV